MRMIGISYYLVYLIFMGCASGKTASSGSGGAGRYSEDLSALRPRIESEKRDTVIQTTIDKNRNNSIYMEPRFAVNNKIDMVLDSIDRLNLSRKFVQGFTIQLYSGKREDAINVRKQLLTLLPEITSEIQFTEPIFRVKAGKYYHMLDAQGDYTLIKKYFPAAIIIPEKIPIPQ
jgi:hypothetical protein